VRCHRSLFWASLKCASGRWDEAEKGVAQAAWPRQRPASVRASTSTRINSRRAFTLSGTSKASFWNATKKDVLARYSTPVSRQEWTRSNAYRGGCKCGELLWLGLRGRVQASASCLEGPPGRPLQGTYLEFTACMTKRPATGNHPQTPAPNSYFKLRVPEGRVDSKWPRVMSSYRWLARSPH
jgi:hypothetical protein